MSSSQLTNTAATAQCTLDIPTALLQHLEGCYSSKKYKMERSIMANLYSPMMPFLFVFICKLKHHDQSLLASDASYMFHAEDATSMTKPQEKPPLEDSTTMLYSKSFESRVINVESTHSSWYFTLTLESNGDCDVGSCGDVHDNNSTLWKVAALQDGVKLFNLSHYLVQCPDFLSTSS